MEDIQKQLEQAGLTKREAPLYMALLQSGPSSIVGIAKKSGMKRPTVYLVLDELLQKGLVSQVPKEKRKLFIALSPELIVEKLEQNAKGLRAVMPELLAFYRGRDQQPIIQLFESGEGMFNVYRDITSRKDIKEVMTFFSFEAIPKEFEKNYEYFIDLLKTGKVRGRDIVSANAPKHFYLEQTRKLPNHEIRQTLGGQTFLSDSIIYGNKIALLSFKKHFALIIESEDIANSFRTLYNLAWQSARPL